MGEQERARPGGEAQGGAGPTPQQVDEALQEAMRREAATREELPDATDQVFDSGMREGMGSRGSESGRSS